MRLSHADVIPTMIMTRSTLILQIAAALYATAMLTSCVAVPARFESLEDRKVLDLSQVLTHVEHEPLLFVGESHSDERDHRFQLELIRYLRKNGHRVVIALEVFPREQQGLLHAWIREGMDARTFASACSTIWQDLFFYYGDILNYARAEGIPLCGIGMPSDLVSAVAQNGPGVVPDDVRRATRYGRCAEDPGYENIIGEMVAMNIHERSMPYFCDAQKLNDSVMAHNIEDIVRAEPVTVVVLAGAAHASKIAVPKMLSQNYPIRYKVLLPATFRLLLRKDVDYRFADYIWH